MIKKFLILFCTISMVFLFVGCGEVGKVEELINAIGEVSINSNDAITAAQSAFDALEDKQKTKVKNAEILQDANDRYAELVREKNYSDAIAAFEAEEYNQAKDLFTQLGDYMDAAERAAESTKAAFYVEATTLFDTNDFTAATDLFLKAADYKDAAERAVEAEKAAFYAEATTLFDTNDFAAAMDLFLKAADYKDAAERAAEAEKASFYTEAITLFDNKKYEEAASLFLKASDYSNADAKLFESGVALLNAGKYAKSVEVLGNCSDSSNKDKYIAYAQGSISFSEGKYEKAKTYFEAAGNIKDAAKMIQNSVYMQAETEFNNGHLNTAKALYTTLPSKFSYNNGKRVEDRLAALKKFNSFVELCGTWSCSDMDASVRQTHDSTGLWDQWDGDGWGDYEVEITCVLNDDDTVTMKAKANFWHYSNYSSLSKYLKTTNDSCTFTYTGKTVPTKMDYSLDFNYAYRGTLTFSGKTFKLNYSIVDSNSSMNFTYTYKSFGTYNKLVKAL